MITFYTFSWKVGTRSFVEVKANNSIDYKFIRPYLYTISKDRLPSDVSFSVVKGKRWTDIILLYEAATHKFFSQRLIDILEQFIDLRNKCYPIDIAGAPFKYYTIYNLEELPYYIDPTCTKVVNKRRYFEMIKDTLAHGATQEAVNNDDLAGIALVIPSERVLAAYHKLTKDIYAQISHNLCENQELIRLRDWLLPMLMNGQATISN
jgi:hypothetical protein